MASAQHSLSGFETGDEADELGPKRKVGSEQRGTSTDQRDLYGMMMVTTSIREEMRCNKDDEIARPELEDLGQRQADISNGRRHFMQTHISDVPWANLPIMTFEMADYDRINRVSRSKSGAKDGG